MLVYRTQPYSNAEEDKQLNICHNYNRARDWCLMADYDAMLTIESDIIPPPDAIERLSACLPPGGVAYGLYVFRTTPERRVVNALQWAPGWKSLGQSLSIKGLLAKSWGKVVRVTGSGLGCTMISREALSKVDFTPTPKVKTPDWAFTTKLHAAGTHQVCDLSVVCGHKDEHGVILTPTIDDKPTEEPTTIEPYPVIGV